MHLPAGSAHKWSRSHWAASSRSLVPSSNEPESGSAASQPPLSLARGAVVLAIDGNDINTATKAGVAALNAGLSPAAAGETHTFQIQDLGASTSRSVTLTSATVTTHSVAATHTRWDRLAAPLRKLPARKL